MNWRDDIIDIIEALRPASMLAVTPAQAPLWDKLAQRQMNCRRISGADLLVQDFKPNRSDVAIVAAKLEHMEKGEAATVIARLRDLYSKVLYAAVPLGDRWPGLVSHWDNQELIVLSLRQMRRYSIEGKSLLLYHYDIYDYKLTPDWLNSKYWANPHMWDKARW